MKEILFSQIQKGRIWSLLVSRPHTNIMEIISIGNVAAAAASSLTSAPTVVPMDALVTAGSRRSQVGHQHQLGAGLLLSHEQWPLGLKGEQPDVEINV